MSRQSELAELSRIYDSSALSNRNLIINGAMKVAQRGTSASSLSSGDAYSTVDRFMRRISSAGTWTQSQSTDVPSGQGFGYSLKMDCTTANSSLSATSDLQIQYRFEGQDIQRLSYGNASAKKMTLSFWVKATKTGTNIVQFYQDDGNDHITKSYTVDTSDTWEYKTITFEGNTAASINNDNTRGLIMQFHLAAGSNKTSGTLATSWASYTEANEAVGQVNHADSTSNNFYLTGVQLEVGDTATPFEHRSYGDELMRCFRYFIRRNSPQDGYPALIAGFHSTSGYFNGVTQFEVEMRATPSLTTSGAFRGQGFADSSSATGTCTIQNASSESCRLNCSGMSFSGTNGQYVHLQQTGGAGHVSFDAEL